MNKVVKYHSNFTKITLLYKKKTNLKLHWKLCEREKLEYLLKIMLKEKIKVLLKMYSDIHFF